MSFLQKYIERKAINQKFFGIKKMFPKDEEYWSKNENKKVVPKLMTE